jgi:hypothetical protein
MNQQTITDLDRVVQSIETKSLEQMTADLDAIVERYEPAPPTREEKAARVMEIVQKYSANQSRDSSGRFASTGSGGQRRIGGGSRPRKGAVRLDKVSGAKAERIERNEGRKVGDSAFALHKQQDKLKAAKGAKAKRLQTDYDTSRQKHEALQSRHEKIRKVGAKLRRKREMAAGPRSWDASRLEGNPNSLR